ncbi:MAG: hypothetical protein U0232_10360 [Thermomicrobiales bacterium]
MQLDFLFDVEAVERETVPDDPEAVVLHFHSGEFSAEVWTNPVGMGELAQAIIAARPKAERSPTTLATPTGRHLRLTIRPRIELASVEVFPPGREGGEPSTDPSSSPTKTAPNSHMALSEETALRIAALGVRELGHEPN